MITRTLLLSLAALALLPAAAMADDNISGDYGHHTVGADNNDDSGNDDHDDHPRDAFDNDHDDDHHHDRADTSRRTAEDGRYPINRDNDDGHHGDFGND